MSQTTIALTAMFFLGGAAAWSQMGPRHGGHNPGPPPAGGWVGNPGGARGPGIYPAPEPPRTYGSPHGYGNVVFPGTGHAPGTYNPFSIVDPTFGTRLANTVSGFGNPYGYNYGRRPYGGGGNAVIVPYAYPIYVPYPEQPPVQYAPYAPQTQVVYVVPGEPDRSMTTAPPRESVITYVVPSRNGTSEPKPASGKDEKKVYLIAFKNYSIYSATDYWVERGETVHYLTPYGAHNQASLDQIDLEFTERLNRERGIEFRLDKDR